MKIATENAKDPVLLLFRGGMWQTKKQERGGDVVYLCLDYCTCQLPWLTWLNILSRQRVLSSTDVGCLHIIVNEDSYNNMIRNEVEPSAQVAILHLVKFHLA